MHLYEDCLQYCDIALQIEQDHIKSIYRKAKSLAFLFDFESSRKIFKELKYDKELIFVD